MRLRVPATLISILSLLLALAYAPYFHVHTDGGLLHAHFFEIEFDHHDADTDSNSTPAVDAGHGHHHASEVSVIAGRAQKLQLLVVDLQSVRILVTLPLQRGVVPEQSAHGPGPPALRDASPRSPPV